MNDDIGRSPLGYAYETGKDELVSLLSDYGAEFSVEEIMHPSLCCRRCDHYDSGMCGACAGIPYDAWKSDSYG